jgi:uncharacterized protein (DUF1800 family)
MENEGRTGFMEAYVATELAKPVAASDALFEKYANKELPKALQKGTAYLTEYTGVWGRAEVIHLLRRTTFGVRQADITTLQAMSMSNAVDYLFSNVPAAAPAPPLNNYNTTTYTDPTGVAAGATWVAAAYGDGTVNSKRRTSLKAWWMGLILDQNLSILEKMVFFWHNHFATELSTIGDARYGYIHHAMLRENALGNFKTLVKKVTVDMAMLRYLNGYVNTKTAPDENYARELQELFTVGKYNFPNYSEDDVKAAARVLTGWRINATTLTSYFDPNRHSTGNKVFSAFYNNTVINYQSGAAGEQETEQLIDMIFAQTETANYICQKLYRYFVYYDIDSTTQTHVIDPLAALLITSNFDIVPVVKKLLKSDHFYDVLSRGCYIRTPLDYIIGTFRTTGIRLPATFTVEQQYKVWAYLVTYAANNGLDLGEPPNVSGFPAWYQTPEYYELWINSNTYPKRLMFTDMMLGSGFTAGTGSTIRIDVLAFTKTYAQAGDPDLLVAYFCSLFIGLDISAAQKDSYKSILLSGQTSNYYWTNAWDTYILSPTTANANIVKPRLTSLLTELTRLPEHQLC